MTKDVFETNFILLDLILLTKMLNYKRSIAKKNFCTRMIYSGALSSVG